jgi:hypothetical protein
MKRVIDSKAVEMTDDEYALYQKICASYDTQSNKGSDLFADLFEVDNDGIIMFLRPPSKRYTSMEVFLFLMSLQQQQHMRCIYKQVDDLCRQVKEKFDIK